MFGYKKMVEKEKKISKENHSLPCGRQEKMR